MAQSPAWAMEGLAILALALRRARQFDSDCPAL
ncbi:MAG: hypothetical protein ACI9PP_001780 [Halobacteriales archaeon]